MANKSDVLDALFQHGMTDSFKESITKFLSGQGISGQGGFLEQLGLSPAKPPTGGQSAVEPTATRPMDALSRLGTSAKFVFSDDNRSNSLAVGSLGALVGAILGGGGKSVRGAIGGGALALLGAIALDAYRSSQQPAPAQGIDPGSQLAAGLRVPENANEEKEVEAIVDLTLKAMINAAKADGRIDEHEMQKILAKLQESRISQTERDYLMNEIRKPMNSDEIVGAVMSPQVAAQVYAASLLAMKADTPTETEYLQKLARDLKLESAVVNQIHSTLS